MPASLKIGAASLSFGCQLIFSDHQKLGKPLRQERIDCYGILWRNLMDNSVVGKLGELNDET
jgi:hypothetical protein